MKKLILIFGLGLFASAAYAAPADKQSEAIPKDNSKKPIQIDADGLEVFQNDQKAIFTGHVIAQQGVITIKSDRMIIYYTGKNDQDAAKPPAPKPTVQGKNAPDAKNSNSSIKRVDVEGNVFMTSPGQSAKSLKGYYDTEKQFIQLTGDVVLTKDDNILKGNRLDYFVDTGYSKVYSVPESQPGTSGRVRGLFIPAQSPDSTANKPTGAQTSTPTNTNPATTNNNPTTSNTK